MSDVRVPAIVGRASSTKLGGKADASHQVECRFSQRRTHDLKTLNVSDRPFHEFAAAIESESFGPNSIFRASASTNPSKRSLP